MIIDDLALKISSENHSPVKAGVIGAGNISGAYLRHANDFDGMKIVAVADLRDEAAQAKAEEYDVKAMSVDAMLADPDIELIINLTIPAVHAKVNMQILNAGKHAYCEKPYGVNREEAAEVLKLAAEKKRLTGCAPDTFLGGAHQTCRKLLDDGWIGKPFAATAYMMSAGPESWHPNAGFYYLHGGGPVNDMAPYYITAMINLLGPIKEVSALTRQSPDRIATSEALNGQILPVEVDTTTMGLLQFESGVIANMVMSFDTQGHNHPPIEIYGERGTLCVPDPNGFGAPVYIMQKRGEKLEMPFTHGYTENFRSIGAADMARAIRTGRPFRANGEVANHALDVMLALAESGVSGEKVVLTSTCERPAMLPVGLRQGMLD